MSYHIYLNEPTGGTIQFDERHDMRGGTYMVGGTDKAWLNVTYNYGKVYCQLFGGKGIRAMHGKTGAETISILKAAIEKLGDDTTDNYWDATEGNAKRPLCQMLAFATMRPDGIWDVR